MAAEIEAAPAPETRSRGRRRSSEAATAPDSTCEGPLDGALWAVGRGLRVIPLQPRSKEPRRGERWRGHEVDDLDVVRTWYTGDEEPNYGIVADASGLVILDEDEAGALDRWQADNGITLPETLTVETGKGRHLYFDAEGIAYGNGSPFRSEGIPVDVRCPGYVVGPGSVHPDGPIYRLAVDRDPARVPEELRRYLTEVTERAQAPAGRLRSTVVAPATRLSAQQAVLRALDELEHTAAMQEGDRDHRGRSWESGTENGGGLLHAHACRLIELSNRDPEGYPLDQAERDYMNRAPAGEEGRFQHHWDDALQHVGDRPARLPEDYSGPQTEVIGDRARDTDGAEPELSHVDLSALLTDGKLPEPPRPSILRRTDGSPLFYSGRVNRLFGDPESGKSWVLLAAAAEELESGGTVAHLDLDHMDRAELVQRLAKLGTPLTVLGDPARFRLYQPGDGADLSRAVQEVVSWCPDLVGLDSLGEVLPMLGLSSNSPDDYTAAHRRVVQPLADAGPAVVIIDHLAKAADSRVKGPGGTLAKGRPIRGVSLRVSMVRLFSPGHGGACRLTIDKDTAGGVRASCPPKGRGAEQQAGVFTLTQRSDGDLDWYVEAPMGEGDLMPELIDEAALERVSRALESDGSLSQRRTAEAAEVRPARVADLLEQLERGGYVRRFQRGQGHMAESIKPYRAGDLLPEAAEEVEG